MNRSRIVVFFTVFLIVLSVAASSFAEEGNGGYYMLIKPGAFIPVGDLDDKGFDNAFSGELTMGRYYSPNLALESAIGYYKTEASKDGEGVHENDDLWVVPVTITFKGVLPLKGAELNAGVGVGIYFANLEIEGTNANGSFSHDDNAVALGGHVVAGVNFNISKKVFLGAEGKYIFTTKAELFEGKTKLDGAMVTGVLGYRF